MEFCYEMHFQYQLERIVVFTPIVSFTNVDVFNGLVTFSLQSTNTKSWNQVTDIFQFDGNLTLAAQRSKIAKN
jgi:hypothetical protein